MCKGIPSKHIPDDIYKLIVELSASKSNREIAKQITEENNYKISYSTVNKLLKEVRQERAEILKDKFTQDITDSLPNDLKIIDNIIEDLYSDYESLIGDVNKIYMKLKVAKVIGATIEIKFRNSGAQEQRPVISWEEYLKNNEGDTYKF